MMTTHKNKGCRIRAVMMMASLCVLVVWGILRQYTTEHDARDSSMIATKTIEWNTTRTLVRIPTHPNASLADDIVSIHHDAHRAEIVVTLRHNATCPRPYLMGRLSGPALVPLTWTWSSPPRNTTTRMTASYELYRQSTLMMPNYHKSGDYFVEIIVVFCNDFFYDLVHNNNNDDDDDNNNNNNNSHTTNNWYQRNSELLKFNFQPLCAEDPWRHRITADNASITVLVPSSNNDNINDDKAAATTTTIGGIWKNMDIIDNNNNNNNRTDAMLLQQPMQPLYTRVQPLRSCYQSQVDKLPLPSECVPYHKVDQFEPYQFQWAPPLAPLFNISNLRQDTHTTVCVMGYSHSRTLQEASLRIALEQSTNITVVWTPAKYPTDVTVPLVQTFLQQHHCDKIVVAVGQWPASFMDHHPTLLDEYYRQLHTMVNNLQTAIAAPAALRQRQPQTPEVEILLRSIHYIPLGYIRVVSCPMEDWRPPTVLDGYNAVIERVSRERNLTFIDTSLFLVQPIYDSGADFTHMNRAPSNAEVVYIVASALGLVNATTKSWMSSSSPVVSSFAT